MKPDSLVELTASGNAATVEAQWMRLADGGALQPSEWAHYAPVLAALVREGAQDTAELLAWAALDSVVQVAGEAAALQVASPFLLVLKNSTELRQHVCGLYRKAHEHREGFEELLEEAGLAGGRPVRRALRTLEVCLNVEPGTYLRARDEDCAARVERINTSDWTFVVHGDKTSETLGAVALADRYRPVDKDNVRVLLQFDPAELVRRVQEDPVAIIAGLCKDGGGAVSTVQLTDLLVPAAIEQKHWKKWWASARAALRQSHHFRIEGRTPATIHFVESPKSPDEEFLSAFQSAHDPLAQLDLVEQHLRACKQRNAEPCPEVARQCCDVAVEEARRGDGDDAECWLVARRIGEALGVVAATEASLQWLGGQTDLDAIAASIQDERLLETLCAGVLEAHPKDGLDRIGTWLPKLPLPVCETMGERLLDRGHCATDLSSIVEKILGDPLAHFDAMLWVWGKVDELGTLVEIVPLTVLSRILQALEQCRRDDVLEKAALKRTIARAKSSLSAKKFAQFRQCVGDMDQSMASTIRTRIKRFDHLGRALPEDLFRIIDAAFPGLTAKPTLPPWERAGVLFVTKEGLSAKQMEIDEHLNVKMRDNARAIGEAAEKGDLSENSEYKFALEERDLLRARLAQMNAELEIAKILDPAEVPTDHIGVGSKVVLQRTDNAERYTMSFLGPWEADIDERCFNYLAPIGQRLMGLQIGDLVEFDHDGARGTYEVVELHNAARGD